MRDQKLHLIFLITVLYLTWAAIPAAYANPAAFGRSSNRPGQIQPIKNRHVRLVDEFVRFDIEIGRSYWDMQFNEHQMAHGRYVLQNISKRSIELDIFFPFGGSVYYRKDPRTLSKIKINEEEQDFQVKADKDGLYPLSLVWSMSFVPHETKIIEIDFPVFIEKKYPYYDFGTDIFTYITHTGSTWNGPIGKATFELCSSSIKRAIIDKKPVLNTNGEYLERLSISPKPYEIDSERSCIVWERENWTPRKGEDDLRVKRETIFTHTFMTGGITGDMLFCPKHFFTQIKPMVPAGLVDFEQTDDLASWKYPIKAIEVKYRNFVAAHPRYISKEDPTTWGEKMPADIKEIRTLMNKEWVPWDELPNFAINHYLMYSYRKMLKLRRLTLDEKLGYLVKMIELLSTMQGDKRDYLSFVKNGLNNCCNDTRLKDRHIKQCLMLLDQLSENLPPRQSNQFSELIRRLNKELDLNKEIRAEKTKQPPRSQLETFFDSAITFENARSLVLLLILILTMRRLFVFRKKNAKS